MNNPKRMLSCVAAAALFLVPVVSQVGSLDDSRPPSCRASTTAGSAWGAIDSADGVGATANGTALAAGATPLRQPACQFGRGDAEAPQRVAAAEHQDPKKKRATKKKPAKPT